MVTILTLAGVAFYIFMMFFTGTFISNRYYDPDDGAAIFGGLFWLAAWFVIAGIELGHKVTKR